MFASPNSTKKPKKQGPRTHQPESRSLARRVTRTAAIAALYAALTLVCLLFLGGLAWGPIQFRLSEAICALALLTADAVPGLALGCVIANLANIAISGTGMLGMLDVVFGSLATLVGAWVTWRLRRHPTLALMGPVVANALIVPAYLPLLLQGMGFYTIPFTSIALDSSYPLMYLFGLVTTGIGESVVMYVLGLPLFRSLLGSPLVRDLSSEGAAVDAGLGGASPAGIGTGESHVTGGM